MLTKKNALIFMSVGILAAMAFLGLATALASSEAVVEYEATHLVMLEPGVNYDSVAKSHGVEVTASYSHIFNGFAGVVPAESLSSLENDPRVSKVEPNMAFQLFDQDLPTGVDRIDADPNPTTNIDGLDEELSVVVGVLDSGIQGDHPDLNVNNKKSVDCTFRGRNCKKGEAKDDLGHGTHVAGTIGALNNNVGVVGVAPGAELWSIRVCASGCFLDHILKGHDYVSANADTIAAVNVSLGGPGWSELWRAAIKSNVDRGVVVVVAAGNSSTDIYGGDGTIGDGNELIPAAFPEAAAVSALADSDGKGGGLGPDTIFGADDTLATFSNFSTAVVVGNPVKSPGAAIDMAAPGVSILSTFIGSSFATLSGTSMASPHAAGAVALYIAANGKATDASGVAAIRQALIDGCQLMVDWRPGSLNSESGPDPNHEGMVYVGVQTQTRDVALTAIGTPTTVVKGNSATVEVTIENRGTETETFDVVLSDLTDNAIIGTRRLTLASGGSITIAFSWDTANATVGKHLLTVSHNLVDDDLTNNSLSSTVTLEQAAKPP